jgi:predicted ribosome-associated RNA-binding protein Tma20
MRIQRRSSWYSEVVKEILVQLKEIKGIQIGKEEVKVLLFSDDILIYISNY